MASRIRRTLIALALTTGALAAPVAPTAAGAPATGWVYATQWQVGSNSADAVDATPTSVVTVSHLENRVQTYTTSGALISQFSIDDGIDAQGVVVAPNGDIYVSDYSGDDVVHVYTAAGTKLGTVVLPAELGNFSPWGLDIDAAGNLYVADPTADTVYRFDSAGVTTIGTPGAGPGQLDAPYDVAIAPDGTVLVADGGNHRISRYTATGSHLGSFGSAGLGPGQFGAAPSSIDVMPDGTIVAAESDGPVQIFAADGTFLQALPEEHIGRRISSVATGPDRSIYIVSLLGNPVQWGVAKYVPAGASTAALAGKKLRVAKGKVKLKIRCDGPAPCAGKVKVRVKGRTVAKGGYQAAPGQTVKVKAKLTKRGRALARGHGKVKATVKVTAAGGTTKTKARLRR